MSSRIHRKPTHQIESPNKRICNKWINNVSHQHKQPSWSSFAPPLIGLLHNHLLLVYHHIFDYPYQNNDHLYLDETTSKIYDRTTDHLTNCLTKNKIIFPVRSLKEIKEYETIFQSCRWLMIPTIVAHIPDPKYRDLFSCTRPLAPWIALITFS